MKCRVMKSLHGRACAPACRIVFILIDRKSQEKNAFESNFFVGGRKNKGYRALKGMSGQGKAMGREAFVVWGRRIEVGY